MQPTLVILAAGMGSRYGGLKQLDPVGPGGATIMDYSVFDALRAGFAKVVFVIRRAFERDFRALLGGRYETRAPVAYAFQELDQLPAGFAAPSGRTKPWGTAHAVLAARPAVDGPFAVINADDFYGQDAFAVLCAFLRQPVDPARPTYAMVAYALRETLSEHGKVSRGVCRIDERADLMEIREIVGIEGEPGGAARYTDADGVLHRLRGDEPVSMNMWGFHPDVFDQFERLFGRFLAEAGDRLDALEFYIPTAVNALIRERRARVRVLKTSERWCGVTYRADRPAVEATIRRLVDEGRYPEVLWS